MTQSGEQHVALGPRIGHPALTFFIGRQVLNVQFAKADSQIYTYL